MWKINTMNPWKWWEYAGIRSLHYICFTNSKSNRLRYTHILKKKCFFKAKQNAYLIRFTMEIYIRIEPNTFPTKFVYGWSANQISSFQRLTHKTLSVLQKMFVFQHCNFWRGPSEFIRVQGFLFGNSHAEREFPLCACAISKWTFQVGDFRFSWYKNWSSPNIQTIVAHIHFWKFQFQRK